MPVSANDIGRNPLLDLVNKSESKTNGQQRQSKNPLLDAVISQKKKVGSTDTGGESDTELEVLPGAKKPEVDLTGYNNLLDPFKKARENQPTEVQLTPQQQLENAGRGIIAKKDALSKSVDIFNNSYGTKFDAKKTLSDPDEASNFLKLYKSKVSQADFDINSKLQPQNIIASSESFGQPKVPSKINILPNVELLTKAKLNEQLLSDQVIDLSVGEGVLKGLTKKQVINNLHKRLDPKGYERTKKAFDDRTEISTWDYIAGDNPLTRDNAKDFELLNTEKAPYEFAYNESLKRQSNDMIVMGTLSGNKALIEGGKSIAAQIQSDDDIFSQFPSLNKSRIAAEISQELAEKTGQLKGSNAEGVSNILNKFRGQADPFNTVAFKKYYDNPSTRDAALQVAANTDEYISDPSFLGGIYKNIAKPFKELGYSALDIVGVRDKMDRLADTKNEELFPEITPELKAYVSKIKGAVNTTSYLTGMMALQIPGTGLGATLGLGAKGAHRVGTAMAFGIPSFDANLKDADNFLNNDASKAAYATLGAMINTVGGEFLELGKISKFGEIQKPMLELAEKITDKNITEKVVAELLDKAKKPYVNALVKYGTNVGKGAATMSYFTFANGVNKMLFGGEGTTKELVENTGTAFIEGVLGMSVLGAFGAHADLKKEKNTSYKQNIYNLALNHDAARDVIETAYKKGEYTRPEYNEKIQILNTAIAANNNVAIAESGNNVTLNEGQKAVYVTNRTAEGVIKKKMESPLLTEEQKGTYEAQLKRLQTQREDILKGLTFNDNLEPLNEIFEAQKEYKKAYEDFNEGVVENDSEVIKAKKNLEVAIANYGKESESTLVTEKQKGTTEAETVTSKNDMAGLSHADWFLKNKDKFTEEEFNRINTELTSTDESVKKNAVNEIISKKEEVKNEGIATNVSETVQPEKPETEVQGTETTVSKSTEPISTGTTETTTSVLEPSTEVKSEALKTEKGNIIERDLEGEKIRNDEGHRLYQIRDKDGKRLGSISVNERTDLGGYQVEVSTVFDKGKGTGKDAYIAIIDSLDKPLISDSSLTPEAKGVWDSLVKDGYAKFDEKQGKYISTKSIQPSTVKSEEVKADKRLIDLGVKEGDFVEDKDGKKYEVKKLHTSKLLPNQQRYTLLGEDGITKEEALTPIYKKSDTANIEGITKGKTTIKSLVDKFDNEEGYVISDLVNDAELIANETGNKKISDAISDYRKEQKEDYELSGRGDMDAANEKIENIIREELKSETKPTVKSEEVNPEVVKLETEITKLEQERDEKIKDVSKPEIKLNLVSAQDLVNSKDPIGNKEKHDNIKERYKELKKLIDCLHG